MGQLDSKNVLYLFVTISLSFLLLYQSISRKTQKPFPPGPKPLPLIGNLLDIPKTRIYKKFEEWAKIYGGIVHINVLNSHIFIINDPKYVAEILESKGRMYSERPKFMMAGELVGWGDGPALRPFDNIWSEQRKYMTNFMGTRLKVEGFERVISAEVRKLLVRIGSNPERQLELFQLYSGSIVLMLVYGYKVVDEHDPLVEVVNKAMDHFGETTQSGAFAVDTFPILRFVPSWFPGATWKTKAAEYRRDVDEMLERPYNWTKEQMKLGIAQSCFLTDILEQGEYTAEQQRIIQWAAAGIYSGGASTTAAALSCFILGIVRHAPELKCAQAEIQALLGEDYRLPTLADRPHLPYFEALCMEIHRFYTIGPLGLQHVAREDDVHDGYFIPKGAIFITNNMLFYRNENLYPNPGKFSPERFLEIGADGRRKQQDPRDFMFGYGRRSCPGVHFANAMLWLASAALITTFDFEPVVDERGQPDIPSGRFLGDIITYPDPFPYVVKPKNKFSESLLQTQEP